MKSLKIANNRDIAQTHPFLKEYVMTLAVLAEKTRSAIVVDKADAEITSAYTSDLLSDVMGTAARNPCS